MNDTNNTYLREKVEKASQRMSEFLETIAKGERESIQPVLLPPEGYKWRIRRCGIEEDGLELIPSDKSRWIGEVSYLGLPIKISEVVHERLYRRKYD